MSGNGKVSAEDLRTGPLATSAPAVRQCLIAGLQRRAAQHQGETRRLIEARLQQLAEPAAALAEPPAAAEPVVPPIAQTSMTGLGSLAGLLAHIAQHAAPEGELRALQGFRASWDRLQMEQRLVQTLAQVPGQAGPLNTQRLLHQALTLMRQSAPAYLQQFMRQVDSLLALDQLAAAPLPVKKGSARPLQAGGRAGQAAGQPVRPTVRPQQGQTAAPPATRARSTPG